MDAQADMLLVGNFHSNIWTQVCGFPAKKYDITEVSHGDMGSCIWHHCLNGIKGQMHEGRALSSGFQVPSFKTRDPHLIVGYSGVSPYQFARNTQLRGTTCLVYCFP